MARLTLSRHEGELIRIGDNVYVEVAKVKGRSVKLTIHAPENVEVVRGEIDDLFDREEPD